jgi:hypothetical protein
VAYEHHSEALLSRRAFALRFLRHALVAAAILLVALALGIVGYHVTERLPWIDSLLNAAMILGGMGPVDVVRTQQGKLFASFYALFSGVLFLAVAGVLVAPLAHRMLHRLHVEVADPR